MWRALRGALLGLVLTVAGCGGGGAEPVGPLDPPAAPTGVLAIPGNGVIHLQWQPSMGANQYHIERAASASGPFAPVADVGTPPWSDSGLANGSTWYYRVIASSEGSRSEPSAVVSASPSGELPLLAEEDRSRNFFGMNVWFLSDWDGSNAFVDVMKHARPWQDGADWHQPVAAVDADGWPLADASTVVISDQPGTFDGRYRLIFEGQAEVTPLWADGGMENVSYDAASNTTSADFVLRYSFSNSVGLIFRNTRRTPDAPPNTGFRNVRLYRPGYASDGSEVFTRPFLAAMAGMRVVRLMDWGDTNGNLVQHWSQRMKPTDAARPGPAYTGPGGLQVEHSGLGLALEHQIQLCNQLLSDCWINIPVVADDDYVRKVALMLRYGSDGVEPYTSPQASPRYPALDSRLRVYIEYANEVWNFAAGFQSFPVIRDIVTSLPAEHEFFRYTEPETNEYRLLYTWPAWRMAAISDTFRQVYGDMAMHNRVRPLLMTQQGDANNTLSLVLNWMDAYARARGRTVNWYVYGAGGSGYYPGVSPVSEADRGNADAFFAPGNFPDDHFVRATGADALLAANFGLRRVAYEGGPSLDFYTREQAQLINLDPRMRDMMVASHERWSAQGGDLLVYYTVFGPQQWEFTHNLSQLDTPKMQALQLLRERPRVPVSLGTPLPGTLVFADWRHYLARTGYDYMDDCGGQACVGGNDAGEWIALPAHTANGQPLAASVRLSARAYTGARVRLYVNGTAGPELDIPAGNDPVWTDSVPLTIPGGLAAVRVQVLSGSVSLRAIEVNPAP